ncbi:MAG: HNH endonuclease [Candidatus Kapaibacterium sp.]|nr:MAG: HNH endonuclease [Candidatus Kapabacteria bacterium]
MQKVFVLDTDKRPLAPCRPKRARMLLGEGKAAVYRRFPFTIILKRSYPDATPRALRAKLDPGSKTTGIALVEETTGEVVFAAELTHRGQRVHEALEQRRGVRRGRRNRHTRYRKPRFLNRTRPRHGNRGAWLPPSLESRLANITTWVQRLTRLSPVKSMSQELVRFDTQKMQDAEISGVEYQQGALQGYEVREYLLEKWQRRCAYCTAKDVPLEVEHIIPKARGGSNRVSNLTLACRKCNERKGTQTAEEFGHEHLHKQARMPLKDTAAVNAPRWELYNRLQLFGLPVELGSGGRTKYNRNRQGYAKAHWIDAACVGASGEAVRIDAGMRPLTITAQGWGNRQMCRVDKYGFPRTSAKGAKSVKGFQTGDMVKAVVPSGAKRGTHEGKVAVRSSGSFNITDKNGTVQGVSYKYCKIVQRCDGYRYAV